MAVMAVSRAVVFASLAAATLVNGDDLSDFLRIWDGRWYELLATDGYPDHVYSRDGQPIGLFAFFPLYPLLVRGVHALPFLDVGDAASPTSTNGSACTPRTSSGYSGKNANSPIGWPSRPYTRSG